MTATATPQVIEDIVSALDLHEPTIINTGVYRANLHLEVLQAPSDTVNIAAVGIGGRGGSDLASMLTENIVAVCDVDDALVDKRWASYKRPASAAPQPWHGSPPRP